jgi:hypothetical protein
MYDDAKRGIAFEFAEHATAGSRCVVVMLHPTGKMGDVDFANRENINWVLNLATSENVNEVKYIIVFKCKYVTSRNAGGTPLFSVRYRQGRDKGARSLFRNDGGGE